jgi:hypothetical protein
MNFSGGLDTGFMTETRGGKGAWQKSTSPEPTFTTITINYSCVSFDLSFKPRFRCGSAVKSHSQTWTIGEQSVMSF